MRNTRLLLAVFFGLALVPFLAMEQAAAQNNVTFQVNMKAQMVRTAFQPGSGDFVSVPGDINGWSTTADTLYDPDGDSIYTRTKSLPTGAITYKFYKSQVRGTVDWEGDPNRTYNVTAGTQTLPVVWFNRDSSFGPPQQGTVTFSVNMKVSAQENLFRPDSGGVVQIAGTLNGWSTAVDTLSDGNNDSIYTITKAVNIGEAQYKFIKRRKAGAGVDWEDRIGGNRIYNVVTGVQTLPTVYFDNDSVVSLPLSANILWRVDMRAMQTIGWFQPGVGDSVQVRGSFEGWSGTRMAFDAISGLYRVTVPYSGSTFDNVPHKFFVKLDSASAMTRFPGYNDPNNRDGIQYDHPYEEGDANRLFNVGGTGGNLVTPPLYFSSVHRYTTMNNTTDTCRVTLRVNMGPATRYITPLNYATDTVDLVFFDLMWVGAQRANQGTFPLTARAVRQGPTDSVYRATFTVRGRTHGGLMYYWRFTQPGGNVVNEGGGLGGSKPYRARWIQQTGPNAFPATYTTPIDSWQRNPPMPTEPLPYGATDVNDDVMGTPLAYTLHQNFPNPFNPATRIRYSIPENARVTLKVFNILGQEVATLVNEDQLRGNYATLFEAHKLSTGVYFYRLEAGKFTETKKMLLLK
jgi:hypothetical protein